MSIEGQLESRVAELRCWLAEHPKGDMADLNDHFKMGFEMVYAIKWLLGQGDLVIRESYVYEPRADERDGDPAEEYSGPHVSETEVKQTGMWRAIRFLAKVSRIVRMEDVQLIAGVSEKYCRDYVSFLVASGFLARRPTGLAVLESAMNHPQTPCFRRDSWRKDLEAERRYKERLAAQPKGVSRDGQ